MGSRNFVLVVGLVWIAWIDGTFDLELRGREDGRRAFRLAALRERGATVGRRLLGYGPVSWGVAEVLLMSADVC